MSFPALLSLLDDDAFARQPTAFRIYMKLAKNQSIFFEPTAVKAWALAAELKTTRDRVQKAIELLIKRGYAIECGRVRGTNVRQLMLLRERAATCTRNGTPSAA